MSEADAYTELARLRRWKDEASAVMMDLDVLGRELGIPLGESVVGPVALAKVRELKAEVQRLTQLNVRKKQEVRAARAFADRLVALCEAEGINPLEDTDD